MKIGEKTLKALGELITNALLTHQGPLNMAFTKNGQDELKIGLKAVIRPGAADGNFKLKADIDYVIEKATDSFSTSVDEKQANLFDKNEPTKVCPMREDGAEIFVSVCEKCNDRESVILIDGKNMPVWKGHKEPIMEPKEGYQMVQFMPCSAWADDDYWLWMIEQLYKAEAHCVEQQEKPAEKKKYKKAA